MTGRNERCTGFAPVHFGHRSKGRWGTVVYPGPGGVRLLQGYVVVETGRDAGFYFKDFEKITLA